ncbi:MAG: patatin-like phospholipase family protein [Chloroflexi bacterium]|nr:patatin-like phospholipase family protein [Chloroflexota bacterium]
MKIGLALGGGGARGIAHIGALRVLESAQVPIDLIVGTSAGALIGSMYAAGKSLDDIEAVVRGLRLQDWMARDRTGMGMFSTDGFRRIIDSAIGTGKRIEELPGSFAAVAVDMEAQTEMVFDSGCVSDAVCASAAFPGIFAPVKIGEHLFIDGGTLNPVPFDVARQRGADVVIAIDLGAEEPLFTAGNLYSRRDAWFFQLILTVDQLKISRVAARAIGIMTRQLRAQKMKQSPPDLIVCPNVQNVGLMDFDLVDVCLDAGAQAARDAMPQIEKIIAPSLWRRGQRAWRKTAMSFRARSLRSV